MEAAGFGGDFEYVDSPTHADKVRFLNSIDVFSVPTDYREPKGLYVLEAWANGVPVVLPSHGCFPELVDSVGSGLLVKPGDSAALAEGLRQLLVDSEARRTMGDAGKMAVAERFTANEMARATDEYLTNILTKTLSVY